MVRSQLSCDWSATILTSDWCSPDTQRLNCSDPDTVYSHGPALLASLRGEGVGGEVRLTGHGKAALTGQLGGEATLTGQLSFNTAGERADLGLQLLASRGTTTTTLGVFR